MKRCYRLSVHLILGTETTLSCKQQQHCSNRQDSIVCSLQLRTALPNKVVRSLPLHPAGIAAAVLGSVFRAVFAELNGISKSPVDTSLPRAGRAQPLIRRMKAINRKFMMRFCDDRAT
jgi:hypothetical protein